MCFKTDAKTQLRQCRWLAQEPNVCRRKPKLKENRQNKNICYAEESQTHRAPRSNTKGESTIGHEVAINKPWSHFVIFSAIRERSLVALSQDALQESLQYKREKRVTKRFFSSSRHEQQQASGSERGKGEKQREEKKVIEAAACCWYVEPSKRDIWFHVSQEIYLFRESSRLALGSLVALILDRLRSLWLCVLLLWHKSNTRNGAVPLRPLIDFVFSTSPYLTLIEYVFHIITIQFRWCWWEGMTTTMSTDRIKNEKKRKHFICDSAKAFWLWPLPRNQKNIQIFKFLQQ